MQKRNISALTIFAVFYIIFGAYLTLFQERVVYIPNNQDFFNCPALLDTKMVLASSTRLYTKIIEGQPIAVLYHGNAGSACDRAMYADIFTQSDFGYILVEYAGYSNDPVPPTHQRIKNDVKNVIDYLALENISKVVVVGESIGTGAASYHASLKPPSALILLTPFTSLTALAKERFWFYPTSLMVDNAFDNRLALQNYNEPVLIIHSPLDSIIPYEQGLSVKESLGSNATLLSVAGANHNNLFFHEETLVAIEKFLKEIQ